MNVLLTGASGLIAQSLYKKLIENNHQVHLLSAKLNKKLEHPYYSWNFKQNFIEKNALLNVDVIVHLAGAGIADEKWTSERKKLLLDSRVETAKLLAQKVENSAIKPKKYISAGAIGIFAENIFNADEKAKKGDDFMADLCNEWEESIVLFKNMGMQTALFRTGIVLDPNGGFYQQIAKLAKFFAAAVPGSGKQHFSWISLHDIVDMYYQAIIDDSIQGTYNATAPIPSTLQQAIKEICKKEKRPLLLPNIPPFILKLIYGEMAQVILSSKHVVPKKWLDEGRTFKHHSLAEYFND